MAAWTKKGDCIVLGPTFPSEGYQALGQDSDRQLIELFKVLQKEFHLYPKMFLYGFSGGAQFSHRFAMKYPDLVAGCSAHSAGTWAGSAGPQAAGVPFALSCGEQDTAKSGPTAPLSRIDWARQFAEKCKAADFYFKVRFWPDAGHASSPGSRQMTEECFCLATTGLYEDQRRAVQQEIDAARQRVEGGDFAAALAAIRKLASLKVPPPAARKDEMKGSQLAGLSENAAGWHEGKVGTAALEAVRQAYLADQARQLADEVEKAALERIAAIEKAGPPDAADQLKALQETFKGQKNVLAAIARAAAKATK
jgi:predicted esterase